MTGTSGRCWRGTRRTSTGAWWSWRPGQRTWRRRSSRRRPPLVRDGSSRFRAACGRSCKPRDQAEAREGMYIDWWPNWTFSDQNNSPVRLSHLWINWFLEAVVHCKLMSC
jgi:hypothetical protein